MASGLGGSGGEDRASKAARLQKILEEYASLKKQNAILKKLMAQEQKKVGELDEAVAAREIQLRSIAEEKDLLAFNVRGLQKRCELLQEELREAESRSQSGGGWFGSGAKQELQQKKEELAVVQRELMAKISENEQIHMQMFDVKKETAQSLRVMEQKLTAMKKQLQGAEDQLQQMQASHSKEVSELSDAKEELAISLSQAEASLQRTTAAFLERETQSKQTLAEYSQELEKSRSLIARKIRFDDTCVDAFNRFNVPPYDRKFTLDVMEVLENGLTASRNMLDHLDVFFRRCSKQLQGQLARIPSETLLAVASQRTLVSLTELLQSIAPLRSSISGLYDAWKLTSLTSTLPVSETMGVELETARAVFFDAARTFLSRYARYSLAQTEKLDASTSSLPPTAVRLRDLNEQLRGSTLQTYSKLEGFVKALQSETITQDSFLLLQFLTEYRDEMQRLAERMRQFGEAFRQETQFMAAEEDLPPAQECLEATGFVSKLLQSFQEFFSLQERADRASPIMVRGCAVSQATISSSLVFTEPMKRSAAGYLADLNRRIEQHVPISLETTLQMQQKLAALQQQIDTLTTQSQSYQQRSAQLLHEKQSLQADLSSLRDSFNQKQARVNSLLNEISVLRKGASSPASMPPMSVASEKKSTLIDLEFPSPPHPPATTGTLDSTAPPTDLLKLWEGSESSLLSTTGTISAPPPSTSTALPSLSAISVSSPSTSTAASGGANQRFTLTVMDECGSQSSALAISPQQREREAEIELYYQAQIRQLSTRIAELDEKAFDLQQIADSASEQVRAAQAKSEEMVLEKKQFEKMYHDIKEELEITRKNYDSQLVMMTQHLVALEQEASKGGRSR